MLKIIMALLLILSVILACPLVAYSQTSNTLKSQDSDIEKNKKIIVEFTNAFNNRSLTAIDALVAKNIIEHRPGAGQGIEATKGFLMALQSAFPDFKTVLTLTIAEGDKVVVFTNTTGTMKGPFMFAPGIKPTGKTYSFQTADLYRIENGKIAEHWDVVEIMDMLQKMGAIKFINTPS
jgi:predicted ester cyclase